MTQQDTLRQKYYAISVAIITPQVTFFLMNVLIVILLMIVSRHDMPFVTGQSFMLMIGS